MKQFICLGFSTAVILVMGSACSRSPSSPTATTPQKEIRGELIQSAVTSTNIAPAPAPQTNTAANPTPPPAGFAPRALPGPVGEPAASDAASAGDEYLTVGFDKLASFTFVMPEDRVSTNATASAPAPEQIPPAVKELNAKRIALKGFMLPLKVESGLVTEMLIMRDQSMCCFGTVPKINEWVTVRMTSKGVKAVMDEPVTVFGKLHVGEMFENGYLVGIYKLDGEKMNSPGVN